MSWSVDDKLYRNTSAESDEAANRAPWRPMTYRLIFRTNNGTNPGVAVPDAHVYIRRIAYTPLPPPARPRFWPRLWSALLPGSGPAFWARSGTSALFWLIGAYFMRRARGDAAADAAAVARWTREREGERAVARARRRGASTGGVSTGGVSTGGAHEDDDEEGTPLAGEGTEDMPLRELHGRNSARDAPASNDEAPQRMMPGALGGAGYGALATTARAGMRSQPQAGTRLGRMALLLADDPGGGAGFASPSAR